MFFPDNSNHRRAFLAIWLGIKYAEGQFLPSGVDLTAKSGVSARTLEIVRAKMAKLGLIKRVSHFSPAFGHRSGWVFSPRLRHALTLFAQTLATLGEVSGSPHDRQKDENSAYYL